MSNLLLTLLSPVVKHSKEWIQEKINKTDQEEISLDVRSPEYSGTANHWVANLYEQIRSNANDWA